MCEHCYNQWRYSEWGNEIKRRAKEYYYANREECKQRVREYRARNYDSVILKEAERREHKADEINARRRRRYKNDESYREATLAAGRRYKKQHPEKPRIWNNRRAALKRELLATLTDREWGSILFYFKYLCAYCGAQGELHQDHYIPLAKQGPYTRGNIVPACPSCNYSKSAKGPKEWLSDRPELLERLEKYIEFMRHSQHIFIEHDGRVLMRGFTRGDVSSNLTIRLGNYEETFYYSPIEEDEDVQREIYPITV